MTDYRGPTLWSNIYPSILDVVRANPSYIYSLAQITFDTNTFREILNLYTINNFGVVKEYIRLSNVCININILNMILEYTTELVWLVQFNTDSNVLEYLISNDVLKDDAYGYKHHKIDNFQVFYKYNYMNSLIYTLQNEFLTHPTNISNIIKLASYIDFNAYRTFLFTHYDKLANDILNTMDKLGIDTYLEVVCTVPREVSRKSLYTEIFNSTKLVLEPEYISNMICHIMLLHADEDDY